MQLSALGDLISNAVRDAGVASLGLAVSGGGDSMALLHAAAGLDGPAVRAVTVDHGLRPEARDEAALVARTCADLGVAHDILTWDGWDNRGNLQGAARAARYALMRDWAGAHGIDAIALAHTRDDQAETVLMRLARKGGVDGLSAMSPLRRADGITWLRPFLDVGRADLRAALNGVGAKWVEDPSNDDPRFDRIRVRGAMDQLAEIGIDASALSAVARNMQTARAALDAVTAEALRDHATLIGGDVVIQRAGFEAQSSEIRRRMLLEALKWVASAAYGPRASALGDLETTVMAGGRHTVHGCLIDADQTTITIGREWNVISGVTAGIGQVWDGRWVVSGPENNGLSIAGLGGAGWSRLRSEIEPALPRQAAITTPAVWSGTELIAAPAAGWANGYEARLNNAVDGPFSCIISH
ncbi:tRNA lysidine(34) synthetase TilS [Rhodovulum sp. FJ3]|uniref:tRNA lysidine(34) synthetase TilS n=1 Tax=Rhodovulum sp. FJ3 TaxID=3079053 RepID=UPI00293DBCCC|nr:tRNA lysidine(34) synthetase TilS [Rhodovulum sp. FJ3]MDV4167180.1 tRNA lysidine(34) synthetase TilS [Rhodovulum sp. FJ3]